MILTLGIPAWQIVLRSVVIYVAVFGGLRLMGKRELGQMTVLDLVALLLVANAVQNAMVGPDLSLTGGLLAAGTLLAVNRLLAAVRVRGGRWGRLLEGTPTVLVQNGELVLLNLHREGLDQDDVEMAMREHGIASLRDVYSAVLETDGTISFVPRDAAVVRTRKRFRQLRRH